MVDETRGIGEEKIWDGTYPGEGMESSVVEKARDGPDGRPVEVEGEVVIDHGVHLGEEGRDGKCSAPDQAGPRFGSVQR